MCQGLSYFQLYSHNLVLTKLAPSSRRVNGGLCLLFYTNHNTASMTGIAATRGRQEEYANQLTISSIFAHLQNLFQHRPSQDNATKESYDKRFVDVFDDTWSKSFRCKIIGDKLRLHRVLRRQRYFLEWLIVRQWGSSARPDEWSASSPRPHALRRHWWLPLWLYLQLLQLARAEDLIGVDLVEVVGGDEAGGRRHGEVKGRGQLLRVAEATALDDCCWANCCCFWRFPRVFW